jgi:hypothetical protein
MNGNQRCCLAMLLFALYWQERSCGVCLQVRKSVKGLKDFKRSEVEPDSVPYLDPARERLRRRALKKVQASGGKAGVCKAAKAQARRVEAAHAAEKRAQEKKAPAAKRQQQQMRVDADDLDDDYRLYRKHKKGKVGDDEYKQSIGIDV